MAKKIPMLMVGCGSMANAWADVLVNHPAVEIIGVVDTDETVALNMAKRFELDESRCFSNLGPEVNKISAQAMLDITPPAARLGVCQWALENGLAVLAEKPLADNMENAQKILNLAKDKKLPVMISQNYRYRPISRSIKKYITDDKIGQIGQVSVFFRRHHHFRGSYRLQLAYPLALDMAIHHFDLMRYLLDAEPLSILAQSWRPQWSWFDHYPSHTAIITFTNEVVVTHNASFTGIGKETSWNGDWLIEGDKGSITWQDDIITWHSVDGKNEEILPLTVDNNRDLLVVLEEFVHSLREGKPAETRVEDNIKSFAMILATIKASEEERKVNLTEIL